MSDATTVEITPATADTDESTPRKKRSGGPRTPEGKERSRRNALKHGMRAEVIVPEDIEVEVAAKREELAAEMQPRTVNESFLVDQIALAQVRLKRLETLQAEDNRRRVTRARLVWEADRFAAAELLGKKLANDAPKHIWTLRRTRQGALWLIDRWTLLSEALQRHGCWDEDQWIMAHDLKGVPHSLRGCFPGLPTTPEEAADDEELLDWIDAEIQSLEDDCEAVLNNLDENERAMTALGMPLDEDAPTARLRRYETSIRRDLRWATTELATLRAPHEPTPREAAPPPPRPVSPEDTVALARDDAYWAIYNNRLLSQGAPDDLLTPTPTPILNVSATPARR